MRPRSYVEGRPDVVRLVETPDGMTLLARAGYTVGSYDVTAPGTLSARSVWQDALDLGAAIRTVVLADASDDDGDGTRQYRLVTTAEAVLLTEGEDNVVVEPLTFAGNDDVLPGRLELTGAATSRDGIVHVLWRVSSPDPADDVVSYGVGRLEAPAMVARLGAPFFEGADPPQFVLGACDESTGRIFVDVHGTNRVHVFDATGRLVETVETLTSPYFLDWTQLPDGLFFGHHNIFVAAFDPLSRSELELTEARVGETGLVAARSMALDVAGTMWMAAPRPEGVGVRRWAAADCGGRPSPACTPAFEGEVVTDVTLGFCEILLTLR